jgi:iron complex outermembrane receptor protein
VVNVITRKGSGLAGGEVALSSASGRANQVRASWGHADGAGTDLLLSLTGFEAEGRRLRFPEMAGLGIDPTASRTDGEEGGKLYARLIRGDWRATLMHSKRKRIVTNGSYATVFDDPAHDEADDYTLAELANDRRLDRHNSLHTRVYSGSYTYKGNFPYDYPSYTLNHDLAEGRWWGLESRLLSTVREGHRWTAGFEYKNNYRQNQWNGDLGIGCFGIGADACLDSRRRSEVYSVYAQDEITLTPATLLTLGLRHDRAGGRLSHWNPRIGLVHHGEGANTYKLLYATAFRDSSVYERYYVYAYGNPDLQAEKMRSLEVTWERRLGPGTRLTATAYQFRLEGLIAPDAAGTAQNGPDRISRGAEIEFERRWPDQATLRTGYSLQMPGGNAGRMDNAPQHMFKLNLGMPLGHESWMAGLEAQAVSRRLSAAGATRVGGYGVANLNITHRPRGAAWDAAFGIYNLFDRRYDDPVALDTDMPVLRDRIPQNGRGYRLKLTVRF